MGHICYTVVVHEAYKPHGRFLIMEHICYNGGTMEHISGLSDIGQILRRAREAAGKSQEDVAEAMGAARSNRRSGRGGQDDSDVGFGPRFCADAGLAAGARATWKGARRRSRVDAAYWHGDASIARRRVVVAAQAPSVLEVDLGSVHVGTIVALSATDSLFSIDDAYLRNETRPTLSLGLLDAYGQPRARQNRIGRIAPFFANVLPEGELRDYIAHRAGVDRRSDFALLWLVGVNLPGAVIVRDPEGNELPPVRVGGPKLKPPNALLRFSLAGVQLKFSAMRNATGGLTIPVSGLNGDSLVKLPSAHFPAVPQNEYAMMQFAQRVGLDVPTCTLVGFDAIDGLPEDLPHNSERAAFAVSRFDRPAAGVRVHIEDFNQLYRQYPEQKYDNFDYNRMGLDIYRLMGPEAFTDFVHRLVFSIAIGNSDMHLKNWSVIYPDGHTPKLAPVYDYLCTSAYAIAGRNELALQLGPSKAFASMDREAFSAFARRIDASPGVVLAAVDDMVTRIHDVWPAVREELPHELEFVRDRIDELAAGVPILREGKGGTTLPVQRRRPSRGASVKDPMVSLKRVADGVVVAARTTIAKSLRLRYVGFIGWKAIGDDDAILFEGASSVHTVGMSLAIDIVFLTRDFTITRIAAAVPPLRPWVGARRARAVLELRAGRAAALDLRVGDRLEPA